VQLHHHRPNDSMMAVAGRAGEGVNVARPDT
jgi:hypothetical protein